MENSTLGNDPSAQRADLVITGIGKNRIYLAYVKCPIGTELCIENADSRNQEHYKDFVALLKRKQPEFQVEIHTIIFAPLVTVPPCTSKSLHRFGLSSGEVNDCTGIWVFLTLTTIPVFWIIISLALLPIFPD